MDLWDESLLRISMRREQEGSGNIRYYIIGPMFSTRGMTESMSQTQGDRHCGGEKMNSFSSNNFCFLKYKLGALTSGVVDES